MTVTASGRIPLKSAALSHSAKLRAAPPIRPRRNTTRHVLSGVAGTRRRPNTPEIPGIFPLSSREQAGETDQDSSDDGFKRV